MAAKGRLPREQLAESKELYQVSPKIFEEYAALDRYLDENLRVYFPTGDEDWLKKCGTTQQEDSQDQQDDTPPIRIVCYGTLYLPEQNADSSCPLRIVSYGSMSQYKDYRTEDLKDEDEEPEAESPKDDKKKDKLMEDKEIEEDEEKDDEVKMEVESSGILLRI